MLGSEDGPQCSAGIVAGGYYRTADIATRDAEGYVTFAERPEDTRGRIIKLTLSSSGAP
jgi:acetyl-CoA synthetase